MGRHKNTDLRQQQIVMGFAEAMAEAGYAGASIGTIAKKADLTPGLLHYHFKSKEEILKALISEMGSYLSQRISMRLDNFKNSSPTNKLEKVIGAFLDLDAGSNLIFVKCWTVIFAEAATNRKVKELVQEGLKEQLDEIKKVVIEAYPEAKARSIEEFSALILAAIQGYILIGTLAPELIPKGSASKMVWNMAVNFEKKA